MSEKITFQYAILRYTNDVETGESLNIGLALYSPDQPYFKVKLLTRYERLTQAFPGMDGEFYKSYVLHLQSEFDRIASLLNESQPKLIQVEVNPDNIQQLLAKVLDGRDAAFQYAETKFGIAGDLDEMFDYLFERFVERYTKHEDLLSRNDDQVWLAFKGPLQQRQVLTHLQPAKLRIKHETIEFEHAWRNGRLNILYPQSFDLVRSESIRRKALTVIGFATVLHETKEQPHLCILAGKPRSGIEKVETAYTNAKEILADRAATLSLEIIEEDQADTFANRIKAEIEAHPT